MKNSSVMTYIMTAWLVSEIIMFTLMTLFVHLYISKSVDLDVRSSLSRQVNSLSDAIIKDRNRLSIDKTKIEKQYPDMYIAIISENGEVIWGYVPDGIGIDTKKSIAPSKTSDGKISYYYIDRDIKYTMSGNNFVRAYVCEDDILADYIPIRIYCYGGMLILFVCLTAVMLYALKRFKHSVRIMESSVEKIGVSQGLDKHIDSKGHYKEITSLIEANNRMIDRMNEIFAQQEQFSSDVAHELRTPVSVIKAQSQSALHNPDISDDEKKSFEVILKQSQKMQNLITTLLELSRLESGESENMQEYIDLTEIVSAVCEAEQDRLSESKIQFSITNTGHSETSGNINLVTIAVTNLITNAVKFSNADGEISVETGQQDDFVFVKVKDNGIGMTEEEQKKVLTRFFKSDSSRNSSGYGLGMPIAYKIAKNHGGTLKVESKLGEGSCFTLYLKKNK